jgi:hypothetical protein
VFDYSQCVLDAKPLDLGRDFLYCVLAIVKVSGQLNESMYHALVVEQFGLDS